MAAATSTTPTYRIGPSDFFTPGDLAADAQTLDGQVDELDTQVEGNTNVDQTLQDQWTAFHTEWKAFYADNFGGFFTNLFTALNDANRDQLIQEETKFSNFAAQFAQAGVASIAGGVVAPSAGSGDTIGAQTAAQLKGLPTPSTSTIVIVVVAIVVLVIVWKVVK